MSNRGISVKLAKELSSLRIVADLSELEREGTISKTKTPDFIARALDYLKNGPWWLASRETIRDRDDEDWFLHLSIPGWPQNQILNDLVVQFFAERRQAAETDISNELFDLLVRLDIVTHARGQLGVNEADADSVVVEKSCSICNSLKDELQVVNAGAALFELHRAAVI